MEPGVEAEPEPGGRLRRSVVVVVVSGWSSADTQLDASVRILGSTASPPCLKQVSIHSDSCTAQRFVCVTSCGQTAAAPWMCVCVWMRCLSAVYGQSLCYSVF